ncbi:hypothetical protein [Filifactor alocis]|uniref:hypothetical protein n=1 Tax=Filifactor alocis TaxID=143361 RepID=UPI003F9FE7EC
MKNILILIDMQNGFTEHPQTKSLSKKIENMFSLNLFDEVVTTYFMNYNNSIYEQLINWERLKSNEDRAIISELQPYIDEVFPKNLYSCVSPNFIQMLYQLNDGVYPKKFL